MLLFPVMNLAAIRHLAGEMIGRETGDQTRDAYREAMLKTADIVPEVSKAIEKLHKEARHGPHLKTWQEARDAVQSIEEITRPYR